MGTPFIPVQCFFSAASVWRNETRSEFLELMVRSGTTALDPSAPRNR